MPVCRDVFVNGLLQVQTLANRFRIDLQRAALGSGRDGFSTVRRTSDGFELTATGIKAAAWRATEKGREAVLF